MRWTNEVCKKGIQRIYDQTRPAITENELWAWLHFENIAHGGEWIETRLLSSGQRTNPWMQESSNKILISRIVKITNPIKDNLLRDLISIEEIMIINIIADVEYKRCLLKKVKSLLIEYDKIRPIVMIDNIIMKFNLLK